MRIDSKKIIQDTYEVFNQTVNQQQKFKDLVKLNKDEYYTIHPKPLTPTNIKIDKYQFLQDIEHYQLDFEQWGTKHNLPRYGLALVNQDGKLKSNDPINNSLYEYNKYNPENPIFETDCTIPTQVKYMQSLRPLNVFDGYFCRSNIFKWYNGAEFFPHIDAFLPSPWIRLWGCIHPENVQLNFYDNEGNEIDIGPIEEGRIYVIDTLLVHSAKSIGDVNYQFFLSVNPHAKDIIKEQICTHF